MSHVSLPTRVIPQPRRLPPQTPALEWDRVPKVTFIPNGTTAEFELGRLPYHGHGKPGSLLDIALNVDVPIEHACGGNCACTTCHVVVLEGEGNLSPMEDGGRGHIAFAARVPGGGPGRCESRDSGVEPQLRVRSRRVNFHENALVGIPFTPKHAYTVRFRACNAAEKHMMKCVRGPRSGNGNRSEVQVRKEVSRAGTHIGISS